MSPPPGVALGDTETFVDGLAPVASNSRFPKPTESLPPKDRNTAEVDRGPPADSRSPYSVLLFTANRSECPLGGNQYSECECDLYSCVRRWSTVDAGAVREEDFGSSWWGYSVGDVDDFLESVAVSIETGRPLGPIFAEAVFRRSVRGYKRAQIDSYLHRLMSESGEFWRLHWGDSRFGLRVTGTSTF